MKRPPGLTPPPPPPSAGSPGPSGSPSSDGGVEPGARAGKTPGRTAPAAKAKPAKAKPAKAGRGRPSPADALETQPVEPVAPSRPAATRPSTPTSGAPSSNSSSPRTGSSSRTSRLGEAWWTAPRETPAAGAGAGARTGAGENASVDASTASDADLTEPIAASPTKRSPKAGSARGRGAAAADAAATVPTARTTGSPGRTPTGKDRTAEPHVTNAQTAKAQTAKAQTAAPPSPGAATHGTAGSWRTRAGDARRQLRRATRSRQRYERDESRRFTQRSRRRRLTWLVTGGALAGLVLVVLLAAYSPLLAVRSVAVEGTARLDTATVTTALDDQLGRPLALVDYGAIERDLAQFPLIESYSVEARPPDTLAIRVVERRPVAQLQTATGFDLIDAAGVTVQQAAERIPGFPLLDLTGTQIGSPGFSAAAAVLMSLPDTLLSQVDRISGTTPDSVTLVFGGAGQRVVWGSAEDSELKAVILQRLIATQDPAKAVEYDVSSPQSPVVR